MSEPIDKALDDFLRATKVVDAINASLPEGLPNMRQLPHDHVIRAMNRDTAGAMLNSTVEALGGIPGMVNWAASDPKNQGLVYMWLMKTLPTETKVEHAGGFTVTTSMPESALDGHQLNSDGFVGDDDIDA